MSKLTKALTAAAGNAGGDNLYVEDVFSTYLYTGTGATLAIDNGIDLSGEGGLVWNKLRAFGSITNSLYQNHWLTDTVRGAGQTALNSNTIDAAGDTAVDNVISSFNSDGFTLSSIGSVASGSTGVSWTFRKAEKFFDVVTYTGDGTATNNISHNLGDVPGFIVVKRTDSDGNWCVAAGDSSGNYKQLTLNNNGQSYVSTAKSNIADSSIFNAGYLGVNFDGSANQSGGTYVAYLFASDAGGFGDDGSESIIKCGSYTGNGSTNGPEIDLGFEPQWLMVKNSTASSDWYLVDTMRGFTANTSDSYQRLMANLSNAEDGSNAFSINSTGFKLVNATYNPNVSGNNYIYIAIRRPMKTPESGTEVFAINDNVASDSVKTTSGITTDVFWERPSYNSGATGQSFNVSQRLTRTVFQTQSTAAEGGPYGSGYLEFDYMDGFLSGLAGSISPGLFYSFKRATGFFDVVAYTGTGVAGSTQAHNLGVVPEFMVIKQRSGANNWICGGTILGTDGWMFLNSNLAQDTQPAYWNNTLPAATQFTVGSATAVNETSQTYIAYLFATLDGVSKVGSYTGNGTSQTIDCGFSGGARFFLVKASSTTGDWHVFDTARGIVAGNDSYLELNTTNAEDTDEDAVDPVSSGVIVNETSGANINTSGVTYIYLAIS